MTRVLAAGDHFVLTSLLAAAVRAQPPGADGLEVAELTLPWPGTPFGRVAEVDEASGTEDALIAALAGARACVTQLAPVTERVLAACPDLELVAISRGGPVNANLDAATEHGVAVCFAPGRNAAATAEHTLALMLATMRRVPQVHAALLDGRWLGDHYAYDQVGYELEGATVGLVGYGAIGSRVARALLALGAHVLVHDPYVEAAALPDGVTAVDLDDLFARSRVVSLHARVTDETRGLVDARRLAALPDGAVLVNCARGALVDYDAVCDALDTGRLAAAAFDVFPEEPVAPDARLLRTPGIVVTPHLAGASRQVAEKAAALVAAEVGRWRRGEPYANLANPAVLDRR